MAKMKFDGVIEAVRYAPDGKLVWVRAYERRGPTFSDRVLLDRGALLERLKAGKKFFAGQRVAYLSSTFDLKKAVRLDQQDNLEFIVAGDKPTGKRDLLEDVPVV